MKLKSIIPLIFANILPIIGVLFWEWDLFTILTLYWAESAVIGIFNILKLIYIDKKLSLFWVPIFIIHYGGFMLVHLIFLIFIFGTQSSFTSLKTALYINSLALILSHGISYFLNFIKIQEYRNRTIQEQMMEPYKRIVVMHLTVILGGWVVMKWQDTSLGIIALILTKTLIDIITHTKAHQNMPKPLILS